MVDDNFDLTEWLTGWLCGMVGRLIFVKKIHDEPVIPEQPAVPESSLYLYGTPSDSGNIGLRSGGVVTLYDGAVLKSIESFYTDDLREQYPYLTMKYHGLNSLLGEVSLSLTTKPMVYYPNEYYNLHADDMGAFDRMLYFGNEKLLDGTHGDNWLYYRTDNGLTNIGSSACWANYTILNEDGSVYLAKSDPIPVSGIVDYDGDIPIYE